MSLIGYIVSIPVFSDSGFVILMPLNKALSKQANISLAGSSVALALGLMTTHCLVPPTPGPIAAAGILEADLGLVIMLGVVMAVSGTRKTLPLQREMTPLLPRPGSLLPT